MDKIKGKVKALFEYKNGELALLYNPIFIILIAIFVYLIWFFDAGVWGILSLGVVAGVVLVISKDVTPIIPVLFMITQVISEAKETFVSYPIYVTAGAIVIVTLIFNIFRYKQFASYGKVKGFCIACAFCGIAIAFGGITVTDERLPLASAVVALIGLFSVFMVFYLTSAMGKDNGKRCAKTVMYTVLLSSAVALLQMITILLRTGDVLGAIASKYQISTGYAHPNYLANIISRSIPIAIYLSSRNKKFSCLYLVVAFICMVGVIVTSSRGSMLMSVIVGVMSLIYFYRKVERKTPWVCTVVALLGVTLMGIAVLGDKIEDVFSKLFYLGIDSNGRFDLWRIGMQRFADHPIFGVGLDYDIGGRIDKNPTNQSYTPYWYHNTVVQIFCCFGIVGVLAFGLYFYHQYKIVIKSKISIAKAMGFVLILMQITSLVDVFFFTPQEYLQMIVITVAILQCAENKNHYQSHIYDVIDLIEKKKKGEKQCQ